MILNPYGVRIGQRWRTRDPRRAGVEVVVRDVMAAYGRVVVEYPNGRRRFVLITSFNPNTKTRGYVRVENPDGDP